jgi:hypothetical protein
LPEEIPKYGAIKICNMTSDSLPIQSIHKIYNISYALTGTNLINIPENSTANFTYVTKYNGDTIIKANIF